MTRRRVMWFLAFFVWGTIGFYTFFAQPPLPFGMKIAEVVIFLSTVSFQLWAEFRTSRESITLQKILDAPMWTIFRGSAEDPGPIEWRINPYVEPMDAYPDDVVAKMASLNVWLEQPEIEDEWVLRLPIGLGPIIRRPDDVDAALAYLRKGGVLCKVPHTMNAKKWRMLIVHP